MNLILTINLEQWKLIDDGKEEKVNDSVAPRLLAPIGARFYLIFKRINIPVSYKIIG